MRDHTPMRILVLLAGLLASACGSAHGELDSVSGLAGTWLLRGTATDQSCPGQPRRFPFSPEAVEVETDGDGMTISSPLAGRVAWAGRRNVFTRQVAVSDETCDAILSSTWRIAAVSQTMLSAVLAIEVDSACPTYANQACKVRFAVSGVRP